MFLVLAFIALVIIAAVSFAGALVVGEEEGLKAERDDVEVNGWQCHKGHAVDCGV